MAHHPYSSTVSPADQAKQAQQEAVINRLDARQADAGSRKRVHPRAPYRRSDVPVRVHHPGGSTSVRQVTTRDISAGGVSFLHNGFLHHGTRCDVVLRRHLGGEDVVHGEVVYCEHVGGVWHLIGLRFDTKIFPKLYLDFETASRIACESVEPQSLHGSVLYIEDQLLDRKLMEHHLKPTRLKLVCVPTLLAAKEVMQKGDIKLDLILLDLNLEEPVPPAEMMSSLRGCGYEGPIALVTAETSVERIRHAELTGTVGVLNKPYDRNKLLSQLAEWLNIIDDTTEAEPIHSALADQPEMRPLLAEFVTSCRTAGRQIKEAINSGDLAKIRQLSLSLKGNGASFGFKLLSTVAAEAITSLEAAGNIEESAIALQRLQDVCSRLTAEAMTNTNAAA